MRAWIREDVGTAAVSVDVDPIEVGVDAVTHDLCLDVARDARTAEATASNVEVAVDNDAAARLGNRVGSHGRPAR